MSIRYSKRILSECDSSLNLQRREQEIGFTNNAAVRSVSDWRELKFENERPAAQKAAALEYQRQLTVAADTAA